jgi:hypothetical protein
MRILHKLTSPFPILSALEISQVPPVESESTPAVPLAYNPIFPRTYFHSGLEDKIGNFTIAPALNPVPKLEGQVNTNPK